jgi:hypothetical protein
MKEKRECVWACVSSGQTGVVPERTSRDDVDNKFLGASQAKARVQHQRAERRRRKRRGAKGKNEQKEQQSLARVQTNRWQANGNEALRTQARRWCSKLEGRFGDDGRIFGGRGRRERLGEERGEEE